MLESMLWLSNSGTSRDNFEDDGRCRSNDSPTHRLASMTFR
jgi:hypothetical protein